MMEKWRVAFLKAVLRQDIGWFDVNQGQQLAGQMGEAMVHIDRACSVPTYQGFMPCVRRSRSGTRPPPDAAALA